MELVALTELFNTVGLPIGLVAILLFIIYQMGVRMNQQADKNMEQVQARCKEREETLMGEIKENREVNSRAIDTIARYNEKLDGIHSDVREIKQDVSLLMFNGGMNHGSNS